MIKSILFAEWIGKNHYKLYNETKENCYWVSESDGYIHRTTKELFIKFEPIREIPKIGKEFRENSIP